MSRILGLYHLLGTDRYGELSLYENACWRVCRRGQITAAGWAGAASPLSQAPHPGNTVSTHEERGVQISPGSAAYRFPPQFLSL